ncbi:MAG TPA: Dyp-type peroxidase [Reyranella sp.]|jgi:putative iron-dependent peroxidase|nr:Dyp-type peroxidase [Reyranella sp.]
MTQRFILSKPLECGLSLSLSLAPGADADKALRRVAAGFDPDWGTLGIGEPLVRALGKQIPGLSTFPAMSAPGVGVPSTQQAMWMMLAGLTQGDIFASLQKIKALLGRDLVIADSMPTFHNASHDLTGYEDGTENPKGRKAERAALVEGGAGMANSSFVAVQRWVHDLDYFNSLSQSRRDNSIGRRLSDNEELENAPKSAHVKRTAQENFEPHGFMVRRSMSFAGERGKGLEFICYVSHLDTFARQMRHMAGLDDGIADALFQFSRPVTGGYYWCPPARGNRPDLRALGL